LHIYRQLPLFSLGDIIWSWFLEAEGHFQAICVMTCRVDKRVGGLEHCRMQLRRSPQLHDSVTYGPIGIYVPRETVRAEPIIYSQCVE